MTAITQQTAPRSLESEGLQARQSMVDLPPEWVVSRQHLAQHLAASGRPVLFSEK